MMETNELKKIRGFYCVNRHETLHFSFDVLVAATENSSCRNVFGTVYNDAYEIGMTLPTKFDISDKDEMLGINVGDIIFLRVNCKEIPPLDSDEQYVFDPASDAFAVYDIVGSIPDEGKLVFQGIAEKLSKERKENKINDIYYPDTYRKLEDDGTDMANAKRGFIPGTNLTEPIMAKGKDGSELQAWNMSSYDFIEGDSPKSVNPVLWRMEKLNNYNGLFQVYPKITCEDGKTNTELYGGKDGKIYQVRSYDLATMTLVKSVTGWIIIDPLGGEETALAAWECFKKNIDANAQIRAILITHSHVDHYKGVNKIIGEKKIWDISQSEYIETHSKKESIDTEIDDVLVVAPNGFYDEAVSENLYLGNCMSRRASYMYGSFLPRDIYGHVGSGLGKTVGGGNGSIPKPSFELTCEKNSFIHFFIDGLTIHFQDVPGTEAPAEFHIYIENYSALCPGENVTYTMHNLLTSRGAKVRDPKAFAKAIDDAIDNFKSIDVIVGTHHWPTWKSKGECETEANCCIEMMEKERDMYRYYNDQVIRMVNKGMNMEEIAETFKLPDSLDKEYYNRGYYGTVNHNVKAVVQRYIGWWDGNPANYFKYPDVEAAKRFVADMGGEMTVLERARQYFLTGDYRWTIELCRQIVFNNPKCEDGRYLEADALEQLAYSFEGGTWRNIFLSAASELRGIRIGDTLPNTPEQFVSYAKGTIASLTPYFAFDYLSTMIDSEKAEGKVEDFTMCFEDSNMNYHVMIENSVLYFKEIKDMTSKDSLKFCSMEAFAEAYYEVMLGKPITVCPDKVKGDEERLKTFFGYFDTFDGQWNIIEPLKDSSL